MRCTGALFDLFGTLVNPFRRREHMETIRECAEHLGLEFEQCHRGWVESFPRRIRGEFAGVADNFEWILRREQRSAEPETVSRAEELYEHFTMAGLEPVPGVMEMLEWLRSRGVRVGLVTNCAPDIPRVWERSPLARYFDYCAFSCRIGAVKPEPAIYHAALDALGLRPEETIYVGDGSDQELSGAARCGMRPVLIAVDLSNTYDTTRSDVLAWSGPVVRAMSDLPSLIESFEQE